MKIYDLLKLCAANLWKRKLRTLLTVLGVVIGTTSIVVMISLGVGLEQSQKEQMSEYMDITTIQVYKNWGDENSILDESALNYIKKMTNVVAATPQIQLYLSGGEWDNFRISSGRYNYTNQVMVIDLSMMESLGYELASGRWPQEGDENTVMFGELAPYYFVNSEIGGQGSIPSPDETGQREPFKVDPMTKLVYISPQYTKTDDNGELLVAPSTIKSFRLTTTGMIKGDRQKDYGNSYYTLYMDYRFYQTLLEEYYKLNEIKVTPSMKGFDQVIVKVNDLKNVADVEKAIQDMGYQTYSFEQIREQMAGTMQTIQMVLGALGAISMLVAAIGIANTMVMSIYERTKEIGVMKVIGCRLNDIRAMFLVEAAGIGLLGGIFGISLSYLLSFLINKFTGNMFGSGSGISQIPLWLVLLGFLFSIAVGVLSGISPANRAAKISALSAIRQD